LKEGGVHDRDEGRMMLLVMKKLVLYLNFNKVRMLNEGRKGIESNKGVKSEKDWVRDENGAGIEFGCFGWVPDAALLGSGR
jgi:hypothetical protein